MKVFFLYSDHLAEDIEMARREIPEVRDGEATICVIAGIIHKASIDEMLETCISVVYVMDEHGVLGGFAYGEHERMGRARPFECDAKKPIIEKGDRIYARDVSCTELDLITSLNGVVVWRSAHITI